MSQKLNVTKIIRIYNNVFLFRELNFQSLLGLYVQYLLSEFFSVGFIIFFLVSTGSYDFDFTFGKAMR